MAFERELRDLALVPRWSIARVIRRQSVAEHTFYVAMYADQIAHMLDWYNARGHEVPQICGWLLISALWHDVEESFTGDIPGPFKKMIRDEEYFRILRREKIRRFGAESADIGPDGSRAGQELQQILDMANTLDELFYLYGEKQMGNKANNAIIDSVENRMWKQWNELPWPSTLRKEQAYEKLTKALLRELSGTSEVLGT